MNAAVAETQPPTLRPHGLSIGNFRRIAAHGFGDAHNSYAYSYAWHAGCLYVGTHRDLLVLAKKRFRFEVPTQIWPVEVPEELDPHEQGGEIWRYDPRRAEWTRVYKSPVTEGLEGRQVPVAAGFRTTTVFQGRRDRQPALYTIPNCGSYGVGPVLLRSTDDGAGFEQLGVPGLGLGDGSITAYRSMIGFQGRLFMAPAGSRGADPNLAYHAVIFCTDDPEAGRWRPANINAFGDPSNYGVYDMCVAGDYLYAGTMNIREGCQLWKTRAEGDPPFQWTKVIDRGGDRAGYYNQGVVCVAEFNGDVYFGTGVQNGGYDKVNNIGPAAGEVIRVHPDDTWDLVVGEPRMTRCGLKIPTSGLGAGFDNPFAGYIWRMCAHEGCLYVGTFDSSSMLPFGDLTSPERRAFDQLTTEQFMRWRGGCELWRTADGQRWTAVTRNGFGNPYNWGVRTLLSTPEGLFVGTANPFGPKVAMHSPHGWRYVDNPQGGIEIWQGSHDFRGSADAVGRESVAPGLRGEESRTLAERALALPDFDRREAAQVASAGSSSAAAGDLLDCLWDGMHLDEPTATNTSHDEAKYRARHELPAAHDSIARLSVEESDSVVLPDSVEAEVAKFFHGTSLRNVGFWRREELAAAEAAATLVEELAALALAGRADLADKSPHVLAIGRGAVAIERAIHRQCPGARVAVYQPGEALAGDSYDAAIRIEGPSEQDRAAALAAIAARLAPGGVFVASDILGVPVEEAEARTGLSYTSDAAREAYAADLAAAGFVDAMVTDVTRETWYRFSKASRLYFASKYLLYHVEREGYESIIRALPGGDRVVDAYIVLRAVKPFTRPD